jgi:Domain of unknown function (DUF4349)
MSAARRSRIRATGIAALAALTVGLLAGCTSSGSSAASGGGGGSGASSSEANGGSHGTPFQTERGAASTAAGKAGLAAADRAVVRTGSLDLTAKDPVHAANAITSIVTGAGGRIDTVTEDPTGDASSFLTVRIPADVFDQTLTAIKREGTVRNVAIHATDVTSQITDYAVRIKGLDTSITRLQRLLGKAGTTTDLVEIESTLTTRETDREQLLAQQAALKDQVSYATLSITVHEPSLARNAPPSTFLTGLAAGWEALVTVGAALIVGIGVVLPWLLPIGVLVGAALLVARAVRTAARRRKPAANDAAS